MVSISQIYTAQSSTIGSVPKPGLQSQNPSVKNARPESPLAPDRFTMGEPWKNKASSGSTSGQKWGAEAYAQQQKMADGSVAQQSPAEPEQTKQEVVAAGAPKGAAGEPLKPEELAQVQELQQIDQKVRAHEQAHMGAAGGLATSGISLSFKKGPDGQSYAVGGEVSIDTSKGSTPGETVAKMMKVRAAALAPADPSGQDRKVAASASVIMGDARSELQLDQRSDNGQTVEQAGENMVAKAEETRAEAPASETRGGYQRGQYQKAASAEGMDVGIGL